MRAKSLLVVALLFNPLFLYMCFAEAGDDSLSESQVRKKREWCFSMRRTYGISTGKSFGRLPEEMHVQYMSAKCHLFNGDHHSDIGARKVKGAISSFRPGGHYICLTFDEGEKPLLTSKIMAILNGKKIHATFFLHMQSIKDGKNMITETIQNGHEVAILGPSDSTVMLAEKQSQFKKALVETKRFISEITKKQHVLTRPHRQFSTNNISDYVENVQGMKVILWSLDAQDNDISDGKDIARRVIKSATPGDVIVMRNDNFAQTVEALPLILDALTRKGYEFLTVSEILSFPDDSPH